MSRWLRDRLALLRAMLAAADPAEVPVTPVEAVSDTARCEDTLVAAEYLAAPYGSAAGFCCFCGRVYPIPADGTGQADEALLLAAAMAHAVADEAAHGDILRAYRQVGS